MLNNLLTMFRNDAVGTIHNCKIAYDLKYKQLQKQSEDEQKCHAMGLLQMEHNFFVAHRKETILATKANVNLNDSSSKAIQILPFVYTFSIQGREACSHYLAWLRHGLHPDIDEELIHIAVRAGLNQLSGHGYHAKLKEAVAAKPAWLAFAPEWIERAKLI